MTRRRTSAAFGISVLAGTAFATRVVLNDAGRRDRIVRTARIWRLTVRRAAHFGVHQGAGCRVPTAERRRELDEHIQDQDRRRRRPRARQHEGRHHEGGPDDVVHPRRPAADRRRPRWPRCRPTCRRCRRRLRRRCRARRTRPRSPRHLPRVGRASGRRGLDRAGAPRGDPRRAHRRRQGAISRHRYGDRQRPRQRRAALRDVELRSR